jgi:plastocyanin
METNIWRTITVGAAAVTIACGAFALGTAMSSNDSGGTAAPGPTTDGPSSGPGSVAPGSAATTAPAGGPGSSVAAGAAQAIDISGFAFAPETLSVPVGSTITWTNDDDTTHSVVSADSVLKSPNMEKGDTYQATLDQPGTVEYYCGIHEYMTATITVTP